MMTNQKSNPLHFLENLDHADQCLTVIRDELDATPNLIHYPYAQKEAWAKVADLLLEAVVALGATVVEN